MTNQLHVYGQYSWHDEATIHGTPSGLRALQAAIGQALKSGEGRATVFAHDGEGYFVIVTQASDEQMDKLPPPYTADFASASLELYGSLAAQNLKRAERAEAERDALREANEQFGKRQEWWNEKMFSLEAERDALKASATTHLPEVLK